MASLEIDTLIVTIKSEMPSLRTLGRGFCRGHILTGKHASTITEWVHELYVYGPQLQGI